MIEVAKTTAYKNQFADMIEQTLLREDENYSNRIHNHMYVYVWMYQGGAKFKIQK